MPYKQCSNSCLEECEDIDFTSEFSCYNKIAGTLTGAEIKEHKLIIPESNSKPKNLQATTYNLTLGEGHYIYSGKSSDNQQKWQLIHIGSDDMLNTLNNKNKNAQQYSRQRQEKPKTLFIPPYGSAFVQLNETVDTYTLAKEKNLLVVGRFDLKLSSVHQGLISQQATQVKPCYQGKLFCFIHNLSNNEIKLKYGEELATIEFSYVSCFCNQEKRKSVINTLIDNNKAKYYKDYCGEMGISEVRYFQAMEQLPDDCGLLGLKDEMTREIAREIKSDETKQYLVDIFKTQMETKKMWLTFWGPIIVALIALIGSFGYNQYSVTQLKTEIEELQEQVLDEQESLVEGIISE